MTWTQQIDSWQGRAEEHPDVRFEVVQINSDVQEEKGIARVYMDMEVLGLGDVRLHAMNVLTWVRGPDQVWRLSHVAGMRGSPGNAGFG